MAQAQNVEFIADWHPGDVFMYNVTKIVQKDKQIDSLNYTMVMTVIDSTEEKYTIKMVYDGMYNNPILDSLLDGRISQKDYETLQTVYYSTNNVGEIIEIDNADTLIKSIIKYSDALVTAVDNDDAGEVMNLLTSLYTKEYLLSGVYKEISLIHNALGYSYPINKPVKGKVKVENTLSGGYFDAKTFFTIEEVGGQQSRAGGKRAFAHGYQCQASGENSIAMGTALRTQNDGEAAFGRFNSTGANIRFSVGGGSSDSDRKNLLQIDADGTIYILMDGTPVSLQDCLNLLADRMDALQGPGVK